ncbi:unnamed protein product, partial [Brassica napus]
VEALNEIGVAKKVLSSSSDSQIAEYIENTRYKRRHEQRPEITQVFRTTLRTNLRDDFNKIAAWGHMLIESSDAKMTISGVTDMVEDALVQVHMIAERRFHGGQNRGSPRKLASAIVTPSRLDRVMEDNVTVRSRSVGSGDGKALTFSPHKVEHHDKGILDAEDHDDDLLGADLMEMEGNARLSAQVESLRSSVEVLQASVVLVQDHLRRKEL